MAVPARACLAQFEGAGRRSARVVRAFAGAVASSFERPACGGLLRMRSETLMVRSAATPRVSNPHGEERGNAARLEPWMRSDHDSPQPENALARILCT